MNTYIYPAKTTTHDQDHGHQDDGGEHHHHLTYNEQCMEILNNVSVSFAKTKMRDILDGNN